MCTLCQALDPKQDYTSHDLTETPRLTPVSDGTPQAAGATVSTTENTGDSGSLPFYTVDQIADYLSEGFWEDRGQSARAFDVAPGETLTVDLSELSQSAQDAAWKALDAWTAVSGIAFAEFGESNASLTRVAEQNDASGSRKSAQRVELNTAFEGTISSVSDVDVLAFEMKAGETYSFAMNSRGSNSKYFDPGLELYNESGKLVYRNDDRAPGDMGAYIEYTPTTSGTHYLKASTFGTAPGDYEILSKKGSSEAVDISFTENSGGAYSSSFVRSGEIISSSVNVSSSWTKYGSSYYTQTFIHEIGHALGLGHAGSYNGSADFSSDAHYANDSWQMTVMSYFNQKENPTDDGSYLRLASPQLADILAIQNIYGTSANSRTGDTIYGDDDTTGEYGFNLGGGLAMTIVDSGGVDTIALGSRSNDQVVDLRQERFSDIGGKDENVAIARGTVIENATTGSGNDKIIGNGAANVLIGGSGRDSLEGGAGDDSLGGGAGSDTILGGSGTDTAVYSGKASGYEAIWNAEFANGGALSIKEIATGAIDRLTGIESLTFSDLVVNVADLASGLKSAFGLLPEKSSQSFLVSLTGTDRVENRAPEAKDDSVEVAKSDSVSIDVLGNDSDPDGDALTVVSVDGSNVRGSATLSADGTVRYDAAGAFEALYAGETETESFNYTVRDTAGNVSTASVTVRIEGSGTAPEPTQTAAHMEIGTTSIQQEGPDQWQRVDFDGRIKDAVVVMGPVSSEGGDPLTVRVRNVTDTGFEFQLDEWAYLDDWHTEEELSWMAGTAGSHEMEDGTRIAFGEALSGQEDRVGMTGFDGAPIVLGQLGNALSGTALTHRIDNVTANGFDFDVQAEERLNGKVSTDGETVYWVGIEDNGALFDSGRASVDHEFADLGAFAEGRAVFADMQTQNEADTATLRYKVGRDGDLGLRLQEEQSLDEEGEHNTETVGWLTAKSARFDLTTGTRSDDEADDAGDAGAPLNKNVLEVGSLSIQQEGPDQWQRVDFDGRIEDAVVVMGPVSSEGGDPLTVRVRNVTDTGFEFQLDEWAYLDDWHAEEELSWMAGTAGSHEMEDGTRISLGSTVADELEGGSVALDGFDDTPKLFAQLTGDAEGRALTHRLDNVSADSFDFDIDVEEGARDSVSSIAKETLYYAAVDAAADGAGLTRVDEEMTRLGTTLGDDAFFADMQTRNGNDTATLRFDTDSHDGLYLNVDEETSLDDELEHNSEEVAWWTLETGVHDLFVVA